MCLKCAVTQDDEGGTGAPAHINTSTAHCKHPASPYAAAPSHSLMLTGGTKTHLNFLELTQAMKHRNIPVYVKKENLVHMKKKKKSKLVIQADF